MWTSLNPRGKSVFLEEDLKWFQMVLKDSPYLKAHAVKYQTQLSQADDLLSSYRSERPCSPSDAYLRGNTQYRLALKNLPDEVYETEGTSPKRQVGWVRFSWRRSWRGTGRDPVRTCSCFSRKFCSLTKPPHAFSLTKALPESKTLNKWFKSKRPSAITTCLLESTNEILKIKLITFFFISNELESSNFSNIGTTPQATAIITFLSSKY
ncbi:hypothetical protein SO802_002621 [Lithocarpus litseifolius]|uniref:Uncharacterized protein n=1 Tax=Lithocarpus litseifolius TaxID=425828 RepID=A0AAW2DY99_9ROSI